MVRRPPRLPVRGPCPLLRSLCVVVVPDGPGRPSPRLTPSLCHSGTPTSPQTLGTLVADVALSRVRLRVRTRHKESFPAPGPFVFPTGTTSEDVSPEGLVAPPVRVVAPQRDLVSFCLDSPSKWRSPSFRRLSEYAAEVRCVETEEPRVSCLVTPAGAEV